MQLVLFFWSCALPMPGSVFVSVSVMIRELVYWANNECLWRKKDYNPMWYSFSWLLQYIIFNFRIKHWVFLQGSANDGWKPSTVWGSKSFLTIFPICLSCFINSKPGFKVIEFPVLELFFFFSYHFILFFIDFFSIIRIYLTGFLICHRFSPINSCFLIPALSI